MAEECGDPTTKLPRALSLCVPVGGIAGLFFVSGSAMMSKLLANAHSDHPIMCHDAAIG